MRVLLAILLTVAQIAGPWQCCCAASRVAAVPRAPAAPTPPCCPHCPPKPPAPDQSPPAPDRCPCSAVFVVAVPAEKSQDWAAVLPAGEFTLVRQAWPGVPTAVTPPSGLRLLPHLTTADRLFAHHVLRC